jgi:hypothetical protein
VAYVIFLMILEAFRCVIRAVFNQGSILDDDPADMNISDFKRDKVNQAVNMAADFFISMSILLLVYYKNREAGKPS